MILLGQIFRLLISIAEGFAFFALLSYVQEKRGYLNKNEDKTVSTTKILFLDNAVRFNKTNLSDMKWFLFVIGKILLSCLPVAVFYNSSLVGLSSSQVDFFNGMQAILGFFGATYAVLRLVSYIKGLAKEYRHKKVEVFSKDFFVKYTGMFLIILLTVTAGVGSVALVLKKVFPEKKIDATVMVNVKDAELHKVSSEASLVRLKVAKIVANYTSFGDKGGAITVTNGNLSFDPMVNATGLGNYSPNGPGVATAGDDSRKLTLIDGVSFYKGSFGGGASRNYCVVVTSGQTYVKYTNTGQIFSDQLGHPLDCVEGK